MNDLLPEMELNMYNVWKCFRATFDTCYLQTFSNERQANHRRICELLFESLSW